MPNSIAVAAFVVGLVLVIAAFIGKELKIAAVEIPALTRVQRVILGILGAFLVVFGLTDGRMLGGVASPASIGLTTPTVTPTLTSMGASADCFPEVVEADRVEVPIQSGRRTDLGFSSGQPREAVLVIEFRREGDLLGGLEFKTHSDGVGFDLVSVVDGACHPITTYENSSRPSQPKDAPYNFDTLNYRFGDTIIAMDVSYGEGGGQLFLRAQQTAP